MTTRSAAISLALLLAPLFPLASLSRASEVQRFFCPKTVFYKPKTPHVRYRCICPKRICPGTPLDNFGYYPTCWQPWPFPPNYSHCPMPPMQPLGPTSQTAEPTNQEQLSQPSKIAPGPSLPLPDKTEPQP